MSKVVMPSGCPAEVVMLSGCPASGKTTVRESYEKKGYLVLSRDECGGKVQGLLEKLDSFLRMHGTNIVLDNTFPTVESRKPFIDMAENHIMDIRCEVMGTKIEDAQINSLNRMWDKYGRLFLTSAEIQADLKAKKDPNIFPAAALFAYRKKFEKPKKEEGFSSVKTIPFKRNDSKFKNKGLFLDVDGVLRETVGGNGKFPTKLSEMKTWKKRGEEIKEHHRQGYSIFLVSNQSGIAKGDLSDEMALTLFRKNIEDLGCVSIIKDIIYCPHRVPPVSCYCRKPQSGMGVYLIRKYELHPLDCIMVGDQTTDKTFAKRLGVEYIDHDSFFGSVTRK